MFLAADYRISSPETVCVACIIFVLKFEDEFNEKFKSFISYIQLELGLSLALVKKCEALVLKAVPDYFIHLPTNRQIIMALYWTIGHPPPDWETMTRVDAFCLNAYLDPPEEMGILNAFLDPIVGITFAGKDCSTAYEKLRAVLVSRGIQLES